MLQKQKNKRFSKYKNQILITTFIIKKMIKICKIFYKDSRKIIQNKKIEINITFLICIFNKIEFIKKKFEIYNFIKILIFYYY